MGKSSTYLIKFDSETNRIFNEFNEKLGWGKRESILKLLNLFSDCLSSLEKNTELVIIVRNENNKEVLKEKTSSFDALNSPK